MSGSYRAIARAWRIVGTTKYAATNCSVGSLTRTSRSVNRVHDEAVHYGEVRIRRTNAYPAAFNPL